MHVIQKTCFKCGAEKPVDEFYRHSAMTDGHLGKCKECTRKAMRELRAANPELARANDRRRHTRRAQIALGNAVRGARVVKESCVVCGSVEVEGHHFDYSRPLDVIWLCTHHHSAFHKIEREIQRAKQEAA